MKLTAVFYHAPVIVGGEACDETEISDRDNILAVRIPIHPIQATLTKFSLRHVVLPFLMSELCQKVLH